MRIKPSESWLRLAALLSVLLVLASAPLRADEIRPALLQLTETQPTVFDVVWKVPARSVGGGEGLRLTLDVQFDSDTEALSSPQSGFVDGNYVQRWRIQRPGGLAGITIGIDGLSRTSVETLLRIEYLDGSALIHRILPDAPHYRVAEPPGLSQVIATYTVLGIEHILLGIDHLLFVLVLLMLVRNLHKLVWTITAFTAAHSITLSLAALDVIRIPVPPVEACIALSIVFVAAEIIRSQQGHPGLAQRSPWLVAFAFGLLHGLGFAAALGEIGLPQTDIPAALLFFNIGVEVGQLLFVAAFLCLAWVLKFSQLRVPVFIRQLPAYGIGSLAAFWTIERTLGFWS